MTEKIEERLDRLHALLNMNQEYISELEEKITELRKAYWDGECTTPDSEYDALVEKLRAVDPGNKLLATPEHGSMAGAKIHHDTPMLSLQKVYNKDDLMKWIASVSRSDDEEFLVQPKYDGISCHYWNGVWATRGDGNVGENISLVCRRMCAVEKADGTVAFRSTDDVYGEIVIRKSVFNTVYKSVKRDNGETFKNPRNAVAGILNSDDYEFYARQGATLTFIDYGKYSFRMKKSEADTKWDIISGVINALDYPMDGIVVKIADRAWYDEQGCTSHHPKGAMAFKFENSSAKTFLKSIDWGMGKEYITATAVFEPVVLNGVKVSRASIPMKSRTLPCVMNGDFNYDAVLTVERAGDVIPHITDIMKSPFGDEFRIDKCPFCGSEIEVLESGVKCKNPDCEEKKLHRLYDSLVQLGIKNVGEATVSDLYRRIGDVHQGVSLYWWLSSIPNCPATIASLDGYGVASAMLIIDETRKILKTTVAKFIAALGIPNVGIKIGREIEQKFTTVRNFVDGSTVDNLASLDGVGKVMASRIRDWIEDIGNRTDVLRLERLFTFEAPSTPANVGGCTVCFTGAMRMLRSAISRYARKAGYTPVDSVTKNLGLLVIADDVELTSSKCQKAQKYGVEMMREDDFLKKIGRLS